MELWAMWLVIVILLSVIEITTVNLVSIWFIASGIISMIVSIFIDNFFLQFGIFAVLGVILMIFTKPILDKWMGHDEKLNLDRIIGMEGIVTEEIKKNIVGEVKVDGKRWSAISDETIPVETIVSVEAIDGVKLIVKNTEVKDIEEDLMIEEILEDISAFKETENKAVKLKSTKKTETSKKKTTKKKSTKKSTSKKASEK